MAAFDQRLQLCVDLFGDAVAVHVPVAHHMAQEAALVGRVKAAPQRLPVRTDAVHHALPRQAVGLRLAREPAQRAQALAQAHRQQRSRVERGQAAMRMRQRQQAMARDHVQRAGVAGCNQRQHGVGHAQAGADDGHGLLTGQGAYAVVVPGLDHVIGGQCLGTGYRQRPHAVAGGEHCLCGVQRLAIAECQLVAVVIRLQAQYRLHDHLQLCRAGRGGLLQALLQVRCKVVAAHVTLAQHLARLARVGVGGHQVVEEIAGLVGKRTHLRRRHVQQVLRPRRGIGDALRQLRSRFEDGQRQRRLGLAQHLDRHQHPGRTTTDDCQVQFAITR